MTRSDGLSANLTRLRHLLHNYGWSRVTGAPSLRGFWYTPDAPRVHDQKTLADYKASRPPFYLVDYRPKLKYSLTNDAGIVVLPYPEPMGRQVNPEAAFQYALGLHDQYLATASDDTLREFMRYAGYFGERQTDQGDWRYEFKWFGSAPGWTSALAQSRGASVMLRAYMIAQDAAYREAAMRALSRFDVPIEGGGYLAELSLDSDRLPYFEEYPQEPTAVLNGFLAALFGLFETYTWMGDERHGQLLGRALASLERMLPLYVKGGWSLYSLDSRGGMPNYDSPHYHALTTSYLAVVNAIDPAASGRFRWAADLWKRQQTPLNLVRYTAVKISYKLRVR